MDIKVTLTSKDKIYSITTNPKWLLDNDEEKLITVIVCGNQCGYNYGLTYENGEPSCYGECTDKIYEDGFEIKFE